MYSNLKTNVFDVAVIWQNNIAVNSFDQFVVTKTDDSLEV